MAEYANMITITAVGTLLFLGGWQPLWPTEYGSWLVPVLLFVAPGSFRFSTAFSPRGLSTASLFRVRPDS